VKLGPGEARTERADVHAAASVFLAQRL
jgi:hypothetical protein